MCIKRQISSSIGKNLLLYFNIIDKQELRAGERSVQILWVLRFSTLSCSALKIKVNTSKNIPQLKHGKSQV